MGLLDQLWDDIVAGPAPDKGLGKLRRCHTFSSSSSSSPSSAVDARRVGDIPITRSITVLKKSPSHKDSGGSSESSTPMSTDGVLSSPNSPMASPFSPPGPWRRTRMRKRRNAPDEVDPIGPRSPTGYDWVIISALDR